MLPMREMLAMVAAAAAVWLGSAALNSSYIPWGAAGDLRTLGSAIAIWIVSTLAMVRAFQASNVESKSFSLMLLVTVIFLILAESLFWLLISNTNNKPMLSRLSMGIDLGFILTGLAAIAALSSSQIRHAPWPLTRCARWIAKVGAGAVVLELTLFIFRLVFHQTRGYYAMDCAMFAVAVLFAVLVVTALCRCIPLYRRKVN